MDFLLILQKQPQYFNNISLVSNQKDITNNPAQLYFSGANELLNTVKENKYFVIGDYKLNSTEEYKRVINSPSYIKNLKGFFYLVGLQPGNSVIISSSVFSILPVYYYENSGEILISSSVELIRDYVSNTLTVNKQFILENILFNYPLFNSSFYNEIQLAPPNSYIKIANQQLDIHKYFNITDYYINKPNPNKKDINHLTSIFVNVCGKYLPAEKSLISFTGGFDGRTLVSTAKYLEKSFETYSFSVSGYDDIEISKINSLDLGIKFHPIYLDNKSYITNNFLQSGNSIIKSTYGIESYIYSHFDYSSRKLSPAFNIQLNGFFGSELFRAVHIQGAFSSAELIKIFTSKLKDEWIEYLRKSPKLKFLNLSNYKYELENLIEDIVSYKNKLNKDFTENQKFYTYVFEEIFRKLFGSHIYTQFKYQAIRSPFLDLAFIKELLKSELAGVNNDFLTHNPLKRYRGQLFYAHMIRKTNPIIYKQITSKGYSPEDLLTSTGKFRITKNYIKKRFARRMSKPVLDNLSIMSGLRHNYNYFQKINNFTEYFNTAIISKYLNDTSKVENEIERDNLMKSLSLSYLLSRI